MFTLTGSGKRNILFDMRLCNPTQLPAQLTFGPAQFASKKAYNFHFFPHPARRPANLKHFLLKISIAASYQDFWDFQSNGLHFRIKGVFLTEWKVTLFSN